MKKHLTYKAAGVDIEKADTFVDRIASMVPKTKRSGALGAIGGFAAYFQNPHRAMKDPVMVSSTDGVGTKLLVAVAQDRHTTVGIDLVAMSVNDVVCCGAEPLFFLDYFATGGLQLRQSIDIMKGIVDGCAQAGCALIGGETAEMPGLYKKGDYDLAGFCVGIVDRPRIITGASVKPGDLVVGLRSSGLHSNGFSLARRVFTEKEIKGAWGRKLLTPTRIYVRPLLELVKRGLVKSIAHITGGGLVENLPRVFPKDINVVIDRSAWKVPSMFGEIQKRGCVSDTEMFRTFNMGIGMTVIVDPKRTAIAQQTLKRNGVESVVIGKAVRGANKVIIN